MCMSPLEAVWNKMKGQYEFPKKRSEKFLPDWSRTLIIPCGSCPECRQKWRTQLGQRVRWELMNYKGNCCFITLTVNDTNLENVFPNGSLHHDHFQLFMKRLRRHLEYHGFEGKIKYLMCGEYGEENGRPHYHAILFGWRPDWNDLRYMGRSQKGFAQYISETLQKLWKKVDATQKEIDDFNNNPKNKDIIKVNGKKFDYLPLGFVKVSVDVDERTAPYMAKYIAKYGEVKQDEFEVKGRKVRKPYMVYPKKRMGIEYFNKHIDQIMSNGFILTSEGKKIGIPKTFIEYLKNSDNIYHQNYYELYRIRCDEFIRQQKIALEIMGYKTSSEQYQYICEQGRIRREMYNARKNNNR